MEGSIFNAGISNPPKNSPFFTWHRGRQYDDDFQTDKMQRNFHKKQVPSTNQYKPCPGQSTYILKEVHLFDDKKKQQSIAELDQRVVLLKDLGQSVWSIASYPVKGARTNMRVEENSMAVGKTHRSNLHAPRLFCKLPLSSHSRAKLLVPWRRKMGLEDRKGALCGMGFHSKSFLMKHHKKSHKSNCGEECDCKIDSLRINKRHTVDNEDVRKITKKLGILSYIIKPAADDYNKIVRGGKTVQQRIDETITSVRKLEGRRRRREARISLENLLTAKAGQMSRRLAEMEIGHRPAERRHSKSVKISTSALFNQKK